MSRHQKTFLKTMGGPPGKPRRILSDFHLDEISAVDFPAQAGARMAIMKRDDPAYTKEHSMNFEQAVEAIQARDRCSGTAAMSAARAQYPDLYKRYQTDGLALVEIRKAESESKNQRPREQDEFDTLVAGIVEREGVSEVEAMRRAARKHPALVAKLR